MDEERKMNRPSFLNNRGNQDDFMKIMDDLERLGKSSMQFLGRIWGMDLEDFEINLYKAKAALPEEIRKANRIISDSDKIISSAKEEAEIISERAKDEARRVIDEAKDLAAKYVDESAIMQKAKEDSEAVLSKAAEEADNMRAGAEDYAHSVMENMEEYITNTLDTLQNGRRKLESQIGPSSYDSDEE